MKYTKKYHTEFHKYLLENKKYYLLRAQYADKVYWKYFKNVKNGTFLEYGCGLGQNIFLHKSNTIGLDISNFCINECNKRGIKTTKIINGKFDGILCCHVLEHLENPHFVLKKIYNSLKPKGILVLVLPIEKNEIIRQFKPTKSQHLFA